MLQTLPRNHSLDSDTDGSLDLGPNDEAGPAGDDYSAHNMTTTASHTNGEHAAGQDLQGVQLAVDESQSAPHVMQEEAHAPGFASCMLTPFAAFASQTRSGSHTPVSHDHNNVT